MNEIAPGLSLDLARGCLMRDGRPVHLRPLSYGVLKHLVENQGRLIGKEELIDRIWEGRAVTDGSIGKCVEEIRVAIGPEGPALVRNVRGRGYIFEPPSANNGSACVPRRRTAWIVAAASVVVVLAVVAGVGYEAAPRRGSAPLSLADQYYQSGLVYRRKGGVEDARIALEYFDRAVAADPRFARGWAAVAAMHSFVAGNSFERPRPHLDAARAAAEKALALDNTIAEAHLTLARINRSEWNWLAARREFETAIALNPNLAEAHDSYGRYLSVVGRPDEALAEIKRAQELDPLNIGFKADEAAALALARRPELAIPLLRQAIAAEPNSWDRHVSLAYVYDNVGRYSEAVTELREAMRIEGETTSILSYLGYALAKSGRTSEAEAILSRLRTTKQYVSPVELSALYIALGRYDAAFKLFEDGYKTHDLQMQFLKSDPHFDDVRSDPRFVELMRRVGLPD